MAAWARMLMGASVFLKSYGRKMGDVRASSERCIDFFEIVWRQRHKAKKSRAHLALQSCCAGDQRISARSTAQRAYRTYLGVAHPFDCNICVREVGSRTSKAHNSPSVRDR